MITPKQNMEFFKERRKKLASMIPHDALILPSPPEVIRNNDVNYPFRQDSNLYYLTGFEEPESVFIFLPNKKPESVLFVRSKDELMETWEGPRWGPEAAKEVFQVDATYPLSELEKVAPQLLKDCHTIYYSLFQNEEFDHRFKLILESIKKLRGRSGRGNLPIKDSYPLLGELRIRKTDDEITLLKKACDISAEAHIQLMKKTRPHINEMELHGQFIYEIMKRGAVREGYTSIVASGNNATTLHYTINNMTLKEGDLLLVDAGAEYQYYTADITRTYPVSGHFTESQKRLYEAVLQVQKSIIHKVKPGMTFKELQEETIEQITEILIQEKVLKGSRKDLIEKKEYKKFYPHGIGHWLGLDVHDAGAYEVNDQPRTFETGMTLTIEPGIYIPQNAKVPEELKGIGIRIEDDILVTPSGCEVLTSKAPKEVKELEALVGSEL
ncbi:MAG: M24 family metallopeptidase [Bdellovibrio sp.]|nr:MAG: M24 family metallopeptidase [Bdellovibrio sp.]